MSGRKPKQESRAAEIRQRLASWKQMPELSRPSLRALARELDVSHELLRYYLAGLENWQHQQHYHEATGKIEGIRVRVEAANRPMTPRENQQVGAWDREALRAAVAPILLDQFEAIKRDAQSGLLNWAQIKMLQLFACHGYPGAEELLSRQDLQGAKREHARTLRAARLARAQLRELQRRLTRLDEILERQMTGGARTGDEQEWSKATQSARVALEKAKAAGAVGEGYDRLASELALTLLEALELVKKRLA